MKQVPLRFPEGEVMPRVEALLPHIRDDEGFHAVRISVSTVLRMCLLAGLDLYERRYGLKG